MSKIYFTNEHEWIAVENGVGIVGVTDYAQKALGDIVFAELPEIGAELSRDGDAAVVESVKAASEVYAPVSGEVVAVNQAIVDQPGLINLSPESDAWFFKVKLSDPSELGGLMDRAAYDSYIAGLE